MSDSHITVSKGGTMFSGDDATRFFQANVIRQGIRLLAVGIRPSRGWTMTKALAMATSFTHKKYKRTQWPRAVADLDLWIVTMRAALPVIHHD